MNKKTILGIIALLSPLSLIISIVVFAYVFSVVVPSNGTATNNNAIQNIGYITTTASLIQLFAIVVYVILAVKNNLLTGLHKAVWILLLLAFNYISVPVYWYMYVKNQA
jgi:hypothetical protein